MNRNQIRIVAHRGGPERAQANTLSAFKRAIDDGADGFECDVALTKDGEPVVIHKDFYTDSIAKLIDQKGRLKDLDWNALRELRTNGERIPHLHDALDFLSSRSIECFIEPKVVSDEIVEKILKTTDEHHVDQKIRLVTFYHRRTLLCTSKRLNPKIKTSVILISPFGQWSKKAETACADMIVPGWKGLTLWKKFNHLRLLGRTLVDIKKKITDAQTRGMLVYSGIANHEENINWLCSMRVDGIFTDNVPLAKRIVSQLQT